MPPAAMLLVVSRGNIFAIKDVKERSLLGRQAAFKTALQLMFRDKPQILCAEVDHFL